MRITPSSASSTLLAGLASLIFLLVPSVSAGVVIDWVTVGEPGNACDTQPQGCFGSVAAPYRISKFEITNAQYVQFLNAVAALDSFLLYNTTMAVFGGIERNGSPGAYTYSTIAGRASWPVNFVSVWDAMRFANWLHNGQPTGAQDSNTTEDGAYTITPGGITANSIVRNPGARFFLPNEDEWYKAAYYGASATYLAYPAGSNSVPTCATPGAAPNTANCTQSPLDALTAVGGYTGSPSPSGTFDQGGNAYEWNETILGASRGLRGGAYNTGANTLAASWRVDNLPWIETEVAGFRVATSTLEPDVFVDVFYATDSIVTGPLSFGLASLPPTVQATIALSGFSQAENIVAGMADVDSFSLSFGDGVWTDLTSFSLVTDATGEVTTLTYATTAITTPTVVANPVLNSFSLTVSGTDIASGQDLEYFYADSSQTVSVTQSVPLLGPWGTGILAAGLAAAGRALAPRRRSET